MSHKIIPLIARIMLSLIFAGSLGNKLMNFEETISYMQGKGMETATSLFLVLAMLFLLMGVISLLLGWKTRLGAGLLILFLVPVSIIFHLDPSNPAEMAHFIKNLGLMGGLLMLISFGPGSWSIDGNAKS